MKLLLDTHVLLWWLNDDPALGAERRSSIKEERNSIYLSAISLAEIAIKTSLGKLEVPPEFDDVVAVQGFDQLAFTGKHAAVLRDLPWHHRDPFDRMLIAQATVEGLTFVTADERCRGYDVAVL